VDTPFRVTEQAIREDACVVAVSGDVDLATIAAMADCLIAAVGRMQIRTVILDLEQVTFMGAIGVESMMNAQDLADRRGTVLRLRNSPTAVLRLLEQCGVRHRFRTYTDAIAAHHSG
jgi:anti-sigma B factor antagonist